MCVVRVTLCVSGIVRAVHQSSSKLGDTPLVRLDLFESLPSRRGGRVEPLQPTLQQNRALQCSTSASLCPAPDVELYSSTALHISTSLQRSTLYILYTPSLSQSGERRHGHIRCRLGFQVVRMRRADGAALAVRQERLVSRSSLTLEPPACRGARGRHSRRPGG